MSGNENQETTVSGETVTLVVEKLFVLRNASFPHHAEEAVETLLDLMLEEQQANDNEELKELMVSLKTMETIIRSTRRPFTSPHFLHQAGGILFALVRESKERSAHFVNSGGLDRSLEIMNAHESDSFLMKAYLALIAVVLDSMAAEQRLLIVGRILLETVVAVMEVHEKDVQLYEFGCHVLRNCFVPDVCLDAELYERAVQCICQGVMRHENVEEAQYLGHSLLIAALGPQCAMEMIALQKGSKIDIAGATD